MAGKLIVIEGTDAVGKQTQSQLLKLAFGRDGKQAEVINFPTYGSEFGKLIKNYLHGKYGDKDKLPPEAISMLYALDRYQYSETLAGKLRSGKYVICNRYSQSNLYQAAKIADAGERRKFIDWLFWMESRLPQADAVVFLNLPVSVSSKLLMKRGRKIDIHEKDMDFQEEVRKTYLHEAAKLGWIVVDCFGNEKLREKQDIADEVFRRIAKKFRTDI